MIYIFLADGFEECEALAPIDILRRENIEIKTVGVGVETVTGSHGIPIVCDLKTSEITTDDLDGIILPGGMPGTLNLQKDKTVNQYIDFCAQNGKLICAICAAPLILGNKNLLQNKNATCYPGFEKELIGANIFKKCVVKDGNIITACGAGAAFDFGFEILSYLKDQKTADNLKIQMRFI